MGQLAVITDANGHETRYEYDARGNLTKETDALGNAICYAYSEDGFLLEKTDAAGNRSEYSYDGNGSLIFEDHSDGAILTNSYLSTMKKTVTADEDGETTYWFDAFGHVISVEYPDGDMVTYGYDPEGRLIRLTYPEGNSVTYAYNDRGFLSKVIGLDGRETLYEYDELGRRVKTTHSGRTITYEFDRRGDLIREVISGGENLTIAYQYDENHQLVRESMSDGTTTKTAEYQYDSLGQLVSFRQEGYEEHYAYDPVGNMLSKQAGDTLYRMEYNAANQLVRMESPEGSVQYTYDANGNLIQKEGDGWTESYEYDGRNCLTYHAASDGTWQEYHYDTLGILQEKMVAGSAESRTTRYRHDFSREAYEVIAECTDTGEGEEARVYEYGLERIAGYSSPDADGDKTEYLYHARGSVIKELRYTDHWLYTSQESIEKSYTPFGEALEEEVSGFGYMGEAYDAEAGSINLRARHYEPSLGRFNQKDVLAGDMNVPLSLNRYVYVRNDGVNYSDPTGMVIASVFSKVAATVKTIAQNTVKKATSVFSAQTVKTQTTNKITGLITKSGQTGSTLSNLLGGSFAGGLASKSGTKAKSTAGKSSSLVQIGNQILKNASGKISKVSFMQQLAKVCTTALRSMSTGIAKLLKNANTNTSQSSVGDAEAKARGELPLSQSGAADQYAKSSKYTGSWETEPGKRCYYIDGKRVDYKAYAKWQSGNTEDGRIKAGEAERLATWQSAVNTVAGTANSVCAGFTGGVMDTLFYGPMYMGASLVDFIKGSSSNRRAIQNSQESFHQKMMQQQVSNPTAYQIGVIGGGIVAGAAMGSATAGSAGTFAGGTTGGANGGVLAFAGGGTASMAYEGTMALVGGVTVTEGGVIGGMLGGVAAIIGSAGKGDGGAGEVTSKDCDKVSDSYLKENGIDAEEVKKEIVGKNGSKYDLYKNKKTGELYVFRKGGRGEGQPTGIVLPR